MEFHSKFGHWIAKNVIQKTSLVFILFMAFIVALAFKVTDFRLDASADSLLLENDTSLTEFREANLKYGSDDYLFLLFSPKGELFTQENLDRLSAIQESITQLNGVESITSILDIPLFDTEETDIFTVEGKSTTLRENQFPLDKAKQIIVNNPIYKDLIISPDGSLTALQINLIFPADLKEKLRLYTEFQINSFELALTEEQKQQGQELKSRLAKANQKQTQITEKLITEIRDIISNQPDDIRLFLGGVPMIANDLTTYVNNDLVVFGGLIFVVLILILTLLFRQIHWILLPLSICTIAVMAMIGLLGWLDWPATVISSNFVALLLIMTMSLTIHLIVRFRELTFSESSLSVGDRLKNTLSTMFMPCLFTALTTMVAFGSLIVSDIRPVKDFGIMMSMGLALAFVIAFIAFPLSVYLSYKGNKEVQLKSRLTEFTSALGRWTLASNKTIMLVATVIAVFAVSGIFRLSVDNRFIDYFRSHTEIYQGMKTIDDNLGGTTPLNILLKTDALLPKVEDEFADEFDDFDDFESDEQEISDWFTARGAQKLSQIHSFLEQHPVTGKVLSLTSSFRLLNDLNNGEPLDDFLLGLFYKRMSEDIRQQLVSPYHTLEGDEVHLSIRMIDSHPDLKRSEFLAELHNYFQSNLGLAKEDYTITGMFVLYNNMLESLFDSQIKTISTVFIAILLMFIPIFRSVKLALIGLIPNALAACMVLGAMGWFGIPLDMMTIMIAAIAIGIGVDNTIHYVFRFRKEYAKRGNYEECVQACHDSIGKALYYTSLTVIAGFSVLIFSNFIPTIYFGVLTSIAMATALLANLTLLPRLILLFKPRIPA